MSFPLYYPPADKTVQNLVKKYPGREIKPNVLLLHTMEVNGWPGYSNGNTAPHLSLRTWLNSDGSLKSFAWRQHFPFNRTARAVRNLAGGVETNNSAQGVIQVELGGTCGWAGNVTPNWSVASQMKKVAQPLIDFLVFANQSLGIKLVAPYPFYAWNKRGKRMSYSQWLSFKGICGHQHVPENTHIDPGLLDIEWLIAQAKAAIQGGGDNNQPTPVDPVVEYKPAPIEVTSVFDRATIKAVQYLTGLRGSDIDGIWGPDSKYAFQKWLFVKRDMVIGPKTVLALQKRVGVPAKNQDKIWGPQTTRYLQLYINKKFSGV